MHLTGYPHKPQRKINWPSAITRLTAHVMCALVSDLVICKRRKEHGHTGHQISSPRPFFFKQHKTHLFVKLMKFKPYYYINSVGCFRTQPLDKLVDMCIKHKDSDRALVTILTVFP